jgi:hypothetical protein
MEAGVAGHDVRTGRAPWWRKAAVLLAVCLLFAVIETMQAVLRGAQDGQPVDFWKALAGSLAPWAVMALLVPGVLALARRFPLAGGRARNVAVHVAAAAAFPVLHLLGTALVARLMRGGGRMPIAAAVGNMLAVYYAMEVLNYALIVGGWYALDFYRKFRAGELEAARIGTRTAQLEAGLSQARLQALSAQLQPHFLFNTLNSIAVLARQGRRGETVRMVTRLADLLRASVRQTAACVPLSEEIAFVRRYLGIEKVRFQDRLSVRWKVQPECLDAEVPVLLLQPLVENAIRHGIAQQTGPGRIGIRASRQGESLVVEVTDNGPGLVGGVSAIREGVGLRNTRERLEQMYGEECPLRVGEAPGGGFRVTVRLPFTIHPAARPPSIAVPSSSRPATADSGDAQKMSTDRATSSGDATLFRDARLSRDAGRAGEVVGTLSADALGSLADASSAAASSPDGPTVDGAPMDASPAHASTVRAGV